MVNNKRSLIIAAIASLLTFLSVAYVSSCSKPGANKYSCEGVVCQNGGYCDSAMCRCPVGYEGANCSIPVVAKYIGTWDATQVVTGTDSIHYLNDTIHYVAFLKKTATPTTFFIDNFTGNPYYNESICVVDTVNKVTGWNSSDFVVDTISGANMIYAHYMLQWGYGDISSDDSTINVAFSVKYINKTVNWETDTVYIKMTPHHF